jgi:hypothetical protein
VLRIGSGAPRPRTSAAQLAAEGVASRLVAADAGLWPDRSGRSRTGWLHAPRTSRPLVGLTAALRERLHVAGRVRVVLAAAGGVGAAATALVAGAGGPLVRLVVLDTTDPLQVADALAGDLEATVLVVSAPPGEETAGVGLVWDAAAAAFRAEGLDPAAHTVAVTEPAGPLRARAARSGATVVLGEPDVAGPWAALTAYALVPAGLAGADTGRLLTEAAAAAGGLADDDPENPALRLGTLLAGDPPVVALLGSRDSGLAEWAAQLLAAGTGKDGRGPVPLAVEHSGAPGWADRAEAVAIGLGEDHGGADAYTVGDVAAQMVLWQYATAVAAHVAGVAPGERPDSVAGDRAATGPVEPEPPAFVDGPVAVTAGPWLPPGTSTVAGALRALVDRIDRHPRGHLAVHAYLDREADASAAVLRAELSRCAGVTTTFGWAPGCLPGGGQHAKGGPGPTAVCQLTGAATDGGEDPAGDPGPLAIHQWTVARADAAALAERGRRVLRLHLADRVAGLVTVARAVQEL